MEEKEIINGECDYKFLRKVCGIPFLIGLVFTIGVFCDGGIDAWIDYASCLDFSIETLLSWGGLILMIFGVLIYISGKDCEIKLTNNKVIGKSLFGNEVIIPIDSISSVGKIKLLKGLVVASNSGCIRFLYLLNIEKLHEEISNLILNRKKSIGNSSNSEEIKKYKELLDDGIITQEEFDKKKKELLNL